MKLYLDERNLLASGVSEQNIRTIRVLTEFVEAQQNIERNAGDIATGAERLDGIEGAIGTDHRTVTTSTAILDSDSVVYVDASGGPITVTLPALSERRFTIKKIDPTGNGVTIAGDVDDDTDIVITTPQESVTLGGGNGEWRIL